MKEASTTPAPNGSGSNYEVSEMAEYRIPEIICFRCPLYDNETECMKAMKRASIIQTKGVCGKIEYDIRQQTRLYGDAQARTNEIVAEAKKRRRAAKKGVSQYVSD